MNCGLHHKLSILLILASSAAFGCSSGAVNSNQAVSNANKTNTNTANSTNDPLATTNVKVDDTSKNAAPTLAPVYKAYCDAWAKNDEAALRKVHSAEALKSYEADMRADKVKTLVDFLQDERVSGTLCEISNEQITGDTAVAVVRTNVTPNGVRRLFVREQGEWKLSNKIPDLESLKKAANTK
jgi:hypothetical protein